MTVPRWVWVDQDESSSTALIRDGARYRVYCAVWWIDPSWMKPQFVGMWEGDLSPAKEAAQMHFEQCGGNPPEVDFT